MKASAVSHQRSLAKVSGETAAANKAAAMRKAKNTFGIMDQTGAAKGRAEDKTLKSFGLKAEPYKAAKKAAAKPAAKENLIQDITNRFRVTAREARDIVTAVGTLGKAVATPAGSYGSKTKNKAATIVKAAGDVAKQAGETATAATRGRSGTSAIKLNTMARGASGLPKDVEYKTGTKRKQGSKK